jgi:hypothetical protein
MNGVEVAKVTTVGTTMDAHEAKVLAKSRSDKKLR